ncbi:MAG: thermonuclease family protein [Candidatus Aenigmatarchaeota archaeon]
MLKKVSLAMIFIIILFLIFLQNQKKISQDYIVVKIIDGDTFKLSDGREIRLLGIDAPEQGQFYYDEAKNFLESLILGSKVVLEQDVTNRDKFGRYLRYVFVENNFVNLELVKKGYARVVIRIPDTKYIDILMQAESQARKNKLGIWSKY